MAVVFDAQSNADITGTSIVSFSSNTTLTVGTGANRALVLAVQWSNSTPPTNITITWDGQALTLIPNTSIGNGSAGNCALYGLINPNSGTKTLAGSWTQSSDFYCGAVAYTGVDQTSIAVAFPNGTTTTGAATPATITQASSTSDAAVGSIVTNTTLGPVTAGTQVYLDNAQPLISGAGIRGAGAANVTFTATTGGGWAASSVDVKAASSSSLTTGGTVFQSDVTDTWQLLYQAKTEPVFVFTTVVVPYAGWDDILEWPRPPQPRSPVYSAPFIAQALGVFLDRDNPEDWTSWPDFVSGRPGLPLHQPWTFIPSPAQVWFPTAPWDDFARRKSPPIDTQPLAWPPTPVATPFPAMGWINWPDFASKQKPAASFTPWTFIPTPAQVFFPYAPWDDFTRRKPQYPDTQPLIWTGQNIAAPAPVMAWTNWPDFAPKKPLAADLWPLAFLPLVPSATTIADWPDFTRRKPQPLDTQPLVWTGQPIFAPQVWFPYDPWPSLIAKKPVPLNYIPATPFIQTPAQVWFPYGPWDDFTRGKPVAQDTQRFAWSNFIPAPTFFLVPDRWPDLVYRKPVPLNYTPLTLVLTVTSPYNSFVNWPDFATKKRPPLNYEPLTYLQLVRTPWNEMSRWPDFVPIRTKAGLNAALQQFSARFPGTITQATITGILSAFEVNSDIASITILVRQSQPAVRAEVSIQEIGTI